MSKRPEGTQISAHAWPNSAASALQRTAPTGPWVRSLKIGQWSIFAVVSALIVVLHVVLFTHSGAFWRDECSSILLARAASWPELWSQLVTDSFPGLFVSILRVWIESGLGATDTGIRLLGILISVATLASVFLSCRAMGVKGPVLAVVLVGLNGAVFYTGSSIRAYGLAALLIVACFAAFWRVALKPTRSNLAAAFALALLSLHCNYQNSYLLFGIGMASASVAAVNRNFLRSLLILATCFIAALTMLVYLPIIASYRGEMVVSNYQLSVAQIGATLMLALSEGNRFVQVTWIALAISPLVLLVVRRLQISRSSDVFTGASPELYCLLTVIISSFTGAAFFKANGMYPFVWHYVPFIALCAVAVECGIQSERYSQWISSAKIIVAVMLAVVCLPNVWDAAHLRRTNMDKIAAVLESEARPGDTILVNPFWLRPSFKKYYQGPISWWMVPVGLSDTNTPGHAGGVTLKTIMAKPDSIRPTLEQVQATLSQGGRVWIVGGIDLLPPNVALPELVPAPHPKFGWDNNAYTQIWSMHLGYFLQCHATRLKVPVEPEKQGVCSLYLENRPLIAVEGWHDP